jgi:uncharacterized Zn finger protein (UPF0148 family)
MTMPDKTKAATERRCCEKISDTYGFQQCRNPAKVERDGKLYCGVHNPVRVDARRAEADRKGRNKDLEREKVAAEQRARAEIVTAAIEAAHQRASWEDVTAAVARLEALALLTPQTPNPPYIEKRPKGFSLGRLR